MPPIDSTNCTMTSATVSRVRLYARADDRWNQRDTQIRNGNDRRVTRASCTLSTSRMTATETTDSSARVTSSMPPSMSSEIESRSDVSRETTRPDVYRSWKLTDSRWKWLNTRLRSSSSTA